MTAVQSIEVSSPTPAPVRAAQATFDPTGRVLSLPKRALYDRRVKDHHLALLCTLGDLDSRHRDGWFEVSQAAIARFRGKSRTAITNAFSDLVRWGYVERAAQRDAASNRKLANRYRLRFDADLEDAWMRSADGAAAGPGYLTPNDVSSDGMSSEVTHQMRSVTANDIGGPHPDGYVTTNDGARSGMSSEMTAHMRYVIPSDDYLKSLKESEDLKGARETCPGKEGKGQPNPGATVSASTLVALFEELHRDIFGLACRPDHERLCREAEAFVGDGLPAGLARQILETVFGRLVVQGHSHVSSLKAVTRTWRFVADKWRAAGRPMDADAWEALFDENRCAWREFQAVYPRPDGLRADATRMAFERAARAAGGAHHLVAAARCYARRMDDTEARWVKTAERWLTGGYWREDLPADGEAGETAAGSGVSSSLDVATIGAAAPQLADVWRGAVQALAKRFGTLAVRQWLGDVDVRPGARADRVVILTRTRFVRDQIDTRFGAALKALFSRALGRPVTMEVQVA